MEFRKIETHGDPCTHHDEKKTNQNPIKLGGRRNSPAAASRKFVESHKFGGDWEKKKQDSCRSKKNSSSETCPREGKVYGEGKVYAVVPHVSGIFIAQKQGTKMQKKTSLPRVQLGEEDNLYLEKATDGGSVKQSEVPLPPSIVCEEEE